MDPVAEFAIAVTTDDPPLDRMTALIAACGRPEVDPSVLVDRLDLLAGECDADSASSLCRSLFVDFGFAGNAEDYYDPRNSLLDQVLARQLGIPITLSVVAMEVGRRRGVGLLGIGMPGHFLLRSAVDAAEYFDAFDRGRPLDLADCRRRFSDLQGQAAPWEDSYLDPTSSLGIVERILNNLRSTYLRRGDRPGLIRTLRLQSVLPGAGVGERRQLAGVLAADGRFVEAAALYDDLAEADRPRADDHRQTAQRLRANLN